MKVSTRDMPYVVSRKMTGATTVASTMRIADMAGIAVFATGGIGGAHRGAELNFDISADLMEFAQSNVAVVTAGAKAILDLGLTLEILETQGVPVVGYGTDEFPAFYSRQSGYKLTQHVDNPDQLASLLHSKWSMKLKGGVVVANPISIQDEIPSTEIAPLIAFAVSDAKKHGIHGKTRNALPAETLGRNHRRQVIEGQHRAGHEQCQGRSRTRRCLCRIESMTNRNNLIGIAALCLGSLVFSLQDSVIKAISGDHAVTLAIVLRAIVSFPIIVAMVAMAGGIKLLDTPHWKMMVLRGAVLLCAYTSYFMAFPALPLAEAIALYFMVPLFITVMSGPLLGEHVSLKAWAAVALGLVGVFIILKPGLGLFEPAALLSLVSAATYAYAMILARKYGQNVPATVMTFYQNAVYLLGALLIAVVVMVLGIEPPGHPSLDFLVRDWKVPNITDLSLMGLCGIIAAVGSTLLSQAYRTGQANIVTPFEYTGMIWAVVFGFAFFGEVPELTTLLGMALIAGAGVLALRAGT